MVLQQHLLLFQAHLYICFEDLAAANGDAFLFRITERGAAVLSVSGGTTDVSDTSTRQQ